ncbi:transcription initiation factor IID, 18 kDa subunit, partial [Ceraceosorus guamensis]
RGRRPYTHRGVFTKDLSRLMYAFGDNAFPDPSSVSVMEELLVDFITDLCHRARPSPFSVARGAMPVVEDVKMALRKEPKKLARVEELIFLDKVISDARKML